jgi:hypothetical protein
MSGKTYREIEAEVVLKKSKAMMIILDDDSERWVPFSVVEDNGEEFAIGERSRLYVEEWFAERESIE